MGSVRDLLTRFLIPDWEEQKALLMRLSEGLMALREKQEEFNSLRGALDSLRAEIGDLLTQASELKTQISQVRGDLKKQGERLSSLSKEIEALRDELRRTQGGVDVSEGGGSEEESEDNAGVPPRKRGGRPRTPEGGDNTEGPGGNGRRQNRPPDVICQKQDREWKVEGSVEGRETLLFKLGSSLERGLLVSRISRGWYLAIVPENWERVGPAPIAPEPVSLPGYQAHYFDLTEGGEVRFRVDGEERILGRRVEFRLIGEEIEDGALRVGPLFRDPPKVQAEQSLWNEVKEIVVGEEGPGEDRWKHSFSPTPEGKVLTLPEELSARGGGWYFLRFYDSSWTLIDSLDFRFFLAFQGIQTDPPGPLVLPGSEGHRPARVTFLHGARCRIVLRGLPGEGVEIRERKDGTVAELPPKPTLDRTFWEVRNEKTTVEVVARIPRVWWTLGGEEETPKESEWQDRAISLRREDFSAMSDRVLWIRVPREIRQIQCGFSGSLRSFRARVDSKVFRLCAVPLWEFSDEEVLQRPGRAPLTVAFKSLRVGTVEVGRLEVRVACRFCDFTTVEKERLLDHLLQEHRDKLYRGPTWEELRALVPSLPVRIYQCLYCDEYVESGGLRNPTSTITRHIETAHPKERDQPGGLKFRIVSDPEEIRIRIARFKDLPRFQICRFCRKRFDLQRVGFGEESLRRHLWDYHREQICNLV